MLENPPDKIKREDRKVPYLILLAGLLSLILVAVYANNSVDDRDSLRFKILTKEIVDTVFDRLDTYISSMRGAVGIYNRNRTLSYLDLKSYTEALRLDTYSPGAQGIGFAPKITFDKLEEHVKAIREEYYPQYDVYPSGERDVYFPSAYLLPADDRNLSSLGFDMLSEEFRRSAMLQAATTGKPSLSSKVLMPELGLPGDSQAGFFVYLPIYLEGAVENPSSIGFDGLEGFIYTPFRAEDFFNGIFKENIEKFVEIDVFDHSSSDANLLFSTTKLSENSCRRCDQISETVVMFGNTWEFRFKALPAFYANSNKATIFALCLFQLLLVLIIWRFARSQLSAKSKLESANREKEELLIRERVARGHAEEASRLKEEFLATVSHELRSPLNAILGWAQIINRPKTEPKNIEKGLQTIEKNVHIQAKLIDDLLEMSRITSGKLLLDIKNVDVEKVVNSALESVDPSLKAKQIQITKNIAPNLPAARADASRLQQVIWNILINAVKFSPEKGKIEIHLNQSENRIVLSIKDHGVGISPDFLPFIFDRFRQENSRTTRKHGGLGLGLAISKNLVELHGGEITVKSDGLGKGSEFSFYLPVPAEDALPLSPAGSQSHNWDSVSHQLKDHAFLVIDDEPDAREMLSLIIRENGARVDCAASVEEALLKLDENDYSIIISDIGMPEQDGYELARKVRSHRSEEIRSKPIIALSAYARENDRLQSRQAGFTAHVAKPLNVQELLQLINHLL